MRQLAPGESADRTPSPSRPPGIDGSLSDAALMRVVVDVGRVPAELHQAVDLETAVSASGCEGPGPPLMIRARRSHSIIP